MHPDLAATLVAETHGPAMAKDPTKGKSDEWQTPPDLASVLINEFAFDLDAAATSGNKIAFSFIGVEGDALKTEWEAPSIYCNPPYSQLPAFVERAVHQHLKWQSTVVLLIPAYTDTAIWWDLIVPHATEIRFLKGRLRFWEHGKVGKDTARFPSALIVFRPEPVGYQRCNGPLISWWDWRAAKQSAEEAAA